MLSVADPNMAVGIAWQKRKAAGVRTVKKTDFMAIPEQVADVYVVPQGETKE
jgi:hypothetical protein